MCIFLCTTNATFRLGVVLIQTPATSSSVYKLRSTVLTTSLEQKKSCMSCSMFCHVSYIYEQDMQECFALTTETVQHAQCNCIHICVCVWAWLLFNVHYTLCKRKFMDLNPTSYIGMTQVVLYYGHTFVICTFHLSDASSDISISSKKHVPKKWLKLHKR